MKRSIISALLAGMLALPIAAIAQSEEVPTQPQAVATASPSGAAPHRRHRHLPAAVETDAPVPAAAANAVATPRGKSQRFMTETAAQAECPNDTVVWMNTRSHVIHRKGDRFYGKTKSGSFVCEHAK